MNPIIEQVATWAVGVASALGGARGIVAFIKSGADRRKIVADTEKVKIEGVALLSATAIELVNSMRTQIADRETHIADLKTRVMATETRAEAAEALLRQSGRHS